jgi:hypothetical protein
VEPGRLGRNAGPDLPDLPGGTGGLDGRPGSVPKVWEHTIVRDAGGRGVPPVRLRRRLGDRAIAVAWVLRLCRQPVQHRGGERRNHG